MESTPAPIYQVVDVASPKVKTSLFGSSFGLFIILAIILGLAFGGGYLLGHYFSQTKVSKKVLSQRTDIKSGFKSYSDDGFGFSVLYPQDWKAQKRVGNVSGVTLSDANNNSVDIWLSVNEPLSLSNEHAAAVDKKSQSDFNIGGEKAKLTEYKYVGGSFVSVITLSATEKHPQVAFWIQAVDENGYDKAKNIVSSILFA